MSLVSSRVSLIHLCTIERDNAETEDGWNNPDVPDWQEHIADLPCRAWATAGREVVTGTDTIVVVEDIRVIVALGTDVTEGDRVASVTYRGDTVQEGPLGIRAVLTRRDHLELLLVKAK